MKSNGYIPLRRGIWDHVQDGSLTPTGALVYIYMLSQADTRTGVWKGSAQCLVTALNIPKSTAKHVLETLEGQYIRRFPVSGSHFCYPILLHKFLITQGEHVGLMLDALKSTKERGLQFFSSDYGQHVVPEVVQQIVPEVGPQRRKEKREERKEKEEKKKEAPAAPSPSIFTGLHFSVTQKQDGLLGEAFPWIDRTGEYRKVDSWLEGNPERRPKNSSRFLHNWFQRIAQSKGGKTNGRETATDLALRNAKALGLIGIN